MIRIREAAAALIEDEAIRQEWLNLEFQLMRATTRGDRYVTVTLNQQSMNVEEKGASISDEDAGRLFFLRAQLIEQVLHRLRSGEWDSQHYQNGSFIPLSADWWKQQNYLDPYAETAPSWEGGELSRLMVEEARVISVPTGANDDAPLARPKKQKTAARPKKRKKALQPKQRGLSYVKDDAPIVKEMRRGILGKPKLFKGPFDAARAIVGRGEKIAGAGTGDSTVKRLCIHYKKAYPDG